MSKGKQKDLYRYFWKYLTYIFNGSKVSAWLLMHIQTGSCVRPKTASIGQDVFGICCKETAKKVPFFSGPAVHACNVKYQSENIK